MNDAECGKRELEREHLAIFLDAYARISLDKFVLLDSETPDFLGHDGEGLVVGVELTQLRFGPKERGARLLFSRGSLDHDAYWRLLELLNKKQETLERGQWPRCERRILIVMLIDASLDEIAVFETDKPDERGFTEVWLADYMQLDAFGSVDLFAVVHPTLSGHFATGNRGQKPFG
jgi:hypothetical protein